MCSPRSGTPWCSAAGVAEKTNGEPGVRKVAVPAPILGYYFWEQYAAGTGASAGISTLSLLGISAGGFFGALVLGLAAVYLIPRLCMMFLKPGVTYRVTHPFGVDELEASPAGVINTTEDTGCLLVPCPFATVGYGRYSALLRWDPTVAPAAPAGYVGSVATPHAIVGSPSGTNFVRLEELDGPGGLPVSTVGETSSFNLQGKQLRYLAVRPERKEAIKQIELVKGSDDTAPVIMAVTVEGLE